MTDRDPSRIDFVRGDATGLDIPAHGAALREAGERFLTEAFRRFGAIAADNAVSRIRRCEPCPGGSTGHKLFLSVDYAQDAPGLHRELFVKFSRDFDDPLRDRGRHELESEVRFAALSRHPAFPIRVPTAYFADYHGESGTGLLITQQIGFGRDGIAPHQPKCLDHELGDSLPYYRAIVRALARLAAAHQSGALSPQIDAAVPFDADAAVAGDKILWDARKLPVLVARYADLAARAPQLFPAHIRTPEFIAGFERDALRFLEHEAAIKRFLHADPRFIALCHWNANIDNAWFWRDGDGRLQCGLMDWGRVRQLNLAYPLWGCLSGALPDIWDAHLDELLDLFVDELQVHGGARLDRDELLLHLQLYIATFGLSGLMIAPERIVYRLPEAVHASGPHDPLFRQSEQARNLLHILTNFLNVWQRHDFGASLDRLLQRLQPAKHAERRADRRDPRGAGEALPKPLEGERHG